MTAEQQLRGFIAKFSAPHQRLIRAVRRVLRRRFPGAIEMVYDNYNFFVIGCGPNERPSDAILSIAAGANGVGLCFIRGARLPDPDGRLEGSGRQTRYIRVPSARVLSERPVVALIAAAERLSRVPFSRDGHKLVIRSVSKKQRPRRRP